MKILRLKTLYVFLVVLTGALFGSSLQEEVNAQLTAKADHDHISINTFYHGSSVSVRGECDAGTDVIIKITSPDKNTVLKQKGKVGGFLWMNTDELEFDATPSLYFVRSDEKIGDMLDKGEANKYVLGYKALEHHISISKIQDENRKDQWFQELVRYNEKKRIYREDNEKITYSGKRNTRSYHTEFAWPYQAQPGEYSVEVFAVKDGKVVETAHSSVLVEQTGAVKFLASTAKNKSALYGIISIVVALVSGFGTGMIVKGGGGAH